MWKWNANRNRFSGMTRENVLKNLFIFYPLPWPRCYLRFSYNACTSWCMLREVWKWFGERALYGALYHIICCSWCTLFGSSFYERFFFLYVTSRYLYRQRPCGLGKHDIESNIVTSSESTLRAKSHYTSQGKHHTKPWVNLFEDFRCSYHGVKKGSFFKMW